MKIITNHFHNGGRSASDCGEALHSDIRSVACTRGERPLSASMLVFGEKSIE